MEQQENNNPSMLRIGTILRGVYRIDSYLASGGFGKTYVATNIEFNERVAIKEFFIKDIAQRDSNTSVISVTNGENLELFAEQKEKFKKEARRMRQLNNPHIVRVHDLFEENGTAYYVMDYIDGENLSRRLERTGRSMSESEVRSILPQILDALKTVHDANIWHLDLKPSNIMLDKSGNVKLIDFGASKQLNTQKGGATTGTRISYTPGYAPREQMEQNYDKFGPWTDIYALGATLYSLLTNKRPPLPTDIDDDISEDKHNALPFPESVGGMKNLVLQMMNTNRLQRPQNVDAIDIEKEKEQSPASESRYSHNNNWVESPWSTDEEDEKTVIDNPRYVNKTNISQIVSNPKERLTQSACGIISVQCSSGKAGVVIDNKYYGMTPLKTTVNEGAHVVNIIKDNLNRTHNVTVWKGQTVEVSAFFPSVSEIKNRKYDDDRQNKPSTASGEETIVDNLRSKDENQIITVNGVSFKMIHVEGGTFMMGPGRGPGRVEDVVHRVALSSYFIGETEVTQALWQAVMGKNPSFFKGNSRPVENVSWDDCQTFIRKLNDITGKNFRLPTEAEWEFAASGGITTKGSKYYGGKYYSGSSSVDRVAWYRHNSGGKTHDVKTKAANELGIYDMSGNVWEWCQDRYGSYSPSAETNPTGPSSGFRRVSRGGSWYDCDLDCYVDQRDSHTPSRLSNTLGLRLALSSSFKKTVPV